MHSCILQCTLNNGQMSILLSIRVDLSGSKTAITSAYSVGIYTSLQHLSLDLCHMTLFHSSQKLAVCSINKVWDTIDRGMCPTHVHVHVNLLGFPS